jgi:type IV pilus assembly protein PilX
MSIVAPNPSPVRVLHLARTRDDGFSLIVSLMMLIVIIILGISGSQMAINEERGARADRDRQIAFQAAEAALKDAEQEIYGSTSAPCDQPGLPTSTRMRSPPGGPKTCFSEAWSLGFLPGCTASPNAGLCATSNATPIYLDANVKFAADAKGSGNNHTVAYGTFTGKVFASQSVLGNTSLPISAYPPRYVIELVPKDVAYTSATEIPNPKMFRVTAVGFGANANTQVMLQSVVATQY